MNATVRQWHDKAETDYRVAEREILVPHGQDYGPVSFHAQQCIEKLMKAALIQHQLVPPYIHNLVGLSRLLSTVEPGWTWDEVDSWI